MADLLECLLQIKGLHGTMERLEALLSSVRDDRWTPAAVTALARLAEMEVLHGAAIRLMLTQAEPLLPASDRAAFTALGARLRLSARQALDRFAARRRDNLELLDTCSAEELSKVGVHPSRRAITLADLIAVMLADDVESVGEIRQELSGSHHEP